MSPVLVPGKAAEADGVEEVLRLKYRHLPWWWWWVHFGGVVVSDVEGDVVAGVEVVGVDVVGSDVVGVDVVGVDVVGVVVDPDPKSFTNAAKLLGFDVGLRALMPNCQ